MPNKKSPVGIQINDLADEQREFLLSIIANSDQNYFLRGVAGSGKTVIAAHGANMLKDDKSVQFLAYTKLLAKYVSDGFDGINQHVEEVNYFDEWEKEINFNINDNYDTIIVDECQDFKSDWIETVKEHSANQIWLGDASQQIYAAAKSDIGFTNIVSEFSNRERTIDLKINYRNSISTAQLAASFITLNEFDKVSLEEKKHAFIEPILRNNQTQSSANNQPNIFIEASSENDEYDCIAKLVKDIQANSEVSKHIAIVQVRHDQLDLMQEELEKRDVDLFRITLKKPNLPNFNENSLTLLSPIHSLKGLTLDYIIFPRIDNELNSWRDPSINDPLLHVLFSRAARRIYCSYVNKENSYIYRTIAEDKDNDFYEFITSNEVLSSGAPELSEEIVEENLKVAEEKIRSYFDDLDIE